MEWMALWMEWVTVAFTSCEEKPNENTRIPWHFKNQCSRTERITAWDNVHGVRDSLKWSGWPAAWGRVASAQRWRRFLWARTPGRAERRWPWRYRWRRWSWLTCHRTTPACDALLSGCHSRTWTWMCSEKKRRRWWEGAAPSRSRSPSGVDF